MDGFYTPTILSALISFLCLAALFNRMSSSREKIRKALTILSSLGALIFSILLFVKIWTSGTYSVEIYQWFVMGVTRYNISIFLDQFGAASIISLCLAAFTVMLSGLITEKVQQIRKVGASFLLSLVFAILCVSSGNYITFIASFIILGIIQSVGLREKDIVDDMKDNMRFVVLIRASEVLIILGLIGFFTVFDTDVFTKVQSQEIESGFEYHQSVTVFSLLIMSGILIRVLQFPLVGWRRLLSRSDETSINILFWAIHFIPMLVLANRVSVIMMNTTIAIQVFAWIGAASLLTLGAMSLAEEKKEKLVGIVVLGVCSGALILIGLSQYVGSLLLFTTTLISVFAINALVTPQQDKKENNLKELPNLVKVCSAVLVFNSVSMLGAPGGVAIQKIILSALSGETSTIIIIAIAAIGYVMIAISYLRFIVERLRRYGKTWKTNGEKYFITLITIILLAVNFLLFKKFWISGTFTSALGVIENAVVVPYLGSENVMLASILTGLIVLIGPLVVIYIYIIKKDEMIPRKFEDSFPGAWQILRKGMYIEEALDFATTRIPKKIRRANSMMMDLRQRLAGVKERGLVGIRNKFQVEAKMELDNFFIVTMAGVLVINGLLVLSFVFGVW